MVTCNVVTPQIFWFRAARTSIPIMFIASLFVNVGMWFERFVIVISLEQDYLPSSWGYFRPTWVDIGTLVGSFGLFMTLFLLFIRYLPVVAIAEIKAVMPQANPHAHHGPGHGTGHGVGHAAMPDGAGGHRPAGHATPHSREDA
jgi:molybdopterin-containing oxidoreductase family membrane subunit